MNPILDLQFYSNELGETVTFRQYLVELARTVWQESEGFSGKRPWGNGGWQKDVYCAMVRARLADGRLDSDGSLNWVNYSDADRKITKAIKQWIVELEPSKPE